MKKVVSFCIYGDDPRYNIGAIKNALLYKEYRPDWTCYFYVNSSVPMETIQTLKLIGNSRIFKLYEPSSHKFTLTRYYVFDDETVDIAIIRDVDARLTAREILVVDDWIASGYPFHVIKDHPTGHAYLISAGMFGAYADRLRGIKKAIDIYFSNRPNSTVNKYGIDQIFLADVVYQVIKTDCLVTNDNPIYESYMSGRSIEKGFLSPSRYPDNHVGAALNADDSYIYDLDANAAKAKNLADTFIYDFDLLETE